MNLNEYSCVIQGLPDQYSSAAFFTQVDNICKKLERLFFKDIPLKRNISTKPMVVYSDTLCYIPLHLAEVASLFNHAVSFNCIC